MTKNEADLEAFFTPLSVKRQNWYEWYHLTIITITSDLSTTDSTQGLR